VERKKTCRLAKCAFRPSAPGICRGANAVERRYPKSWLPFLSDASITTCLLSWKCIVKRWSRRQGSNDRSHVRCPHFSWISVRPDQPRNRLYHPVESLLPSA